MNVLFITLDQLRADCVIGSSPRRVPTPNLDRLAAAGVTFSRHYSQAAPCAPGRASLYTGMYQFNHRVVANGTPLDDRFDNVARAARRAGFTPVLFGYTDQAADPRTVGEANPADPRLTNYQGVLPGFDVGLELLDEQDAWRAWLESLGYGPFEHGWEALETEGTRPAEHGVSAFLTDHLVAWIARQDGPWFAHASYWRPHPPYAAAGHWSTAFDPGGVPLPIAPSTDRHWLHNAMLGHPLAGGPADEATTRSMVSQYFGMIADVDAQVGRVWDALERAGQWDDTYIVLTSDHGEMLGDHGLIEKGGFFEASYHVPCVVRDPRPGSARGIAVERFTENVDVLPTLCEAMGLDVPVQCDGMPLSDFVHGREPAWWRSAAHWEYDWRGELLGRGHFPWPWDRRLEQQYLAVIRDDVGAYVHFGDGSELCFDLEADASWRTPQRDPSATLAYARRMLRWRGEHADRTLASVIVRGGIVGR